jgi:hypothetical protein
MFVEALQRSFADAVPAVPLLVHCWERALAKLGSGARFHRSRTLEE